VAVNLLFTIDVDNDGAQNDERTELSWASIDRIPHLKDLFDRFNLHLTWFIRADNQLQDIYGTAAYILLEHEPLLSELERSGDEVAWHPHLNEWCEESRHYFADRDEHRCVQKLIKTRAELEAKGFKHSSVRIGEAFQGNAMMKTLDELGLKVDSTAIPGRTRSDESRAFDWGPTPNRPYHPSSKDYRVPDAGDSLNILEVPMTTMPVKASYDPDFLTRYINPAFHRANFKAGLDRSFATLFPATHSETFLTLILHSDEISFEGRTHPLYSFSLEGVRKNIAYLLESLEANGLEYRSIRLKDVPGRWSEPQLESA
jgi:hypothetical protein